MWASICCCWCELELIPPHDGKSHASSLRDMDGAGMLVEAFESLSPLTLLGRDMLQLLIVEN